MSMIDISQGNTSMNSQNDDTVNSATNKTTSRRHHIQNFANVQPLQSTPQPKTASVVDERDKQSFYRDLFSFHENKGTPIPRVPRVNGREIDLHKFYALVCERGGWSKVNFCNEWEDLVDEFDLPKTCVNASVALKQIYMRYLDRCEKVHFFGDDNDRNNDDMDDDTRHKKWSNKNLNEIPLKYNYNQHNVSETARITNKLSNDLYRASEYERLLMSLMSPLPNEQDFAINVCTLMANESKNTLKIDHCPKLIDALLGHAGVYSHFSLRELFNEFYSKIRNHPLQSFWNDCLAEKPEVLELTYDDYFQSPDEKVQDVIPNRPPIRLRPDGQTFDDGLNIRPNERDDFTSVDFLNLSRGLGTHDYVGQRVTQVTSIFRNLSFMDENISTLVKNRPFIRFLVMTSNIRWGNLHQMALDMLGNVASELDLWDPTSDDLTRCLMSLVAEGIESPDRGVIISCLEILCKLSQKPTNDDYLHKCLSRKTYEQICLFLSLNDIMLLLYTLECLFALSSLGEKSCYHIVQVRGVMDSLVSLVSVEAQSYGPDGCILMRVVETVPTHFAGQSAFSPNSHHNPSHHHHSNHPQYQHQFSPSNFTPLQSSPPPISCQPFEATIPPPEAHKILTVQSPLSSPPPQPVLVTSSKPQPITIVSQNVNTTPTTIQTLSAPVPSVSIVSPPALASPSPVTFTVPPTPSSVVNVVKSEPSAHIVIATQNATAAKHAQQQAGQENEQFALAWLRATFENVNNIQSRIEKQDLYKMYLTASSKVGRTGVVTQLHFPRCVRSVFGGTVGPNQVKIKQNNTETIGFYYEAIRIRAKPLAVVHKGTILQASVTTTPVQGGSDNTVKTEHIIPVKGSVVTSTMPHQQLPKIQNSILVAQLSGKNQQQNQTGATGPILQQVLSNQSGENVVVVTQNQVQNHLATTPISTPSSLIKSLLANKVTTSDALSASSTITTNVASSIVATTNVNVPQVAQRQHLQKQKEAQQQQQQHLPPVIQLAAGAQIKATGLHQNLPTNIKTSVTTNTVIPATIIEKKPELVHEKVNWDPVPPLAPLSSGIHTPNIRQTNIVATIQPKLEEDSTNVTNTNNTNSATPGGDDPEGTFAGFEGTVIPKSEDDLKDGLNRPPQVVTANKMLADLLDKKSSDPPFNIATAETPNKRKRNSNEGDPPTERIPGNTTDQPEKGPTSNAANLYAKLAASLLEDEDMEGEETQPAAPDPQKSVITVPMQRQIIVSPNNPPQVILAPTPATPPIGQATATIKTESGFQTVPVILQQHNSNPVPNIQIQKQIGGLGQQINQPVMLPQATQYMFATNQQGQTILVAQQQPQQVNQILVTQTTQQQGGPTKTIIILQQQPGPGGPQPQILGTVNTPGTPQKVIINNQQGQSMIVTQVPRPVQHHVIMNQHPHSTGTVVQTNSTLSNTSAIINQTQPQLQLQNKPLPQSGQIQHQTIQIQRQPIQNVINKISK